MNSKNSSQISLSPTFLNLSLINVITIIFFLFLLFLPVYAAYTDSPYLLTQFGRILIFALAAIGLNLALGFGGMVSFGHAMYIGIGAYCVGIASHYGYDNGLLHLLIVLLVSAIIAVPVGLIALRTQGIAFIMITLALAQMFYFMAIGLKQYGGDEGLPIHNPSNFGSLTGDHTALYLALLLVIIFSLLIIKRLVFSQFGLVLRASSVDQRRVKAVGNTPMAYQLVAYIFSAQLCALAGFFLANLTSFASPAYMAWTASGELIIMVLLGGVGTIVGPVVGATAFLLLEEGLKALTDHWMIIMGPVIILIVIFFKNGLWGVLDNNNKAKD